MMFGGAFFGLLVSVGLLMLKFKIQSRSMRTVTSGSSPRNDVGPLPRHIGSGDRNRAVLDIERDNVYAEDLQ